MLLARLRDEQRVELNDAIASASSIRLYRRFKTIDLADRGYSAQEIAGIFDLCDATVRTYIHDFEKGIRSVGDEFLVFGDEFLVY